jgi:hypothetical protein
VQAAHHLVRIKQVFPGPSGGAGADTQEFVVLQLTGLGENQLATVGPASVKLFNATTQSNSATFTSNPLVGTNQATVLVATANAEALFNVVADLQLSSVNGMDPAGGAACLDSPMAFGVVDCVEWGTGTSAPLPIGTGIAEAAIPPDNMLNRSIAAGCPTFFETADDTNDSAADFAPVPIVAGSFTPRNNAAPITEVACGTGGGGSSGGGTTSPNTFDLAAAKKKCKKKFPKGPKRTKCIKKAKAKANA